MAIYLTDGSFEGLLSAIYAVTYARDEPGGISPAQDYQTDLMHRPCQIATDPARAARVMAAPFWDTIARMPAEQRREATYLRNAFASFLITGPFSILVGFEGGLMALHDRLKLRSMVVGEKGDLVYVASEEAAIRAVEPELDSIRAPRGGEAVLITLDAKKGGPQ